jgi:hypothetical protein
MSPDKRWRGRAPVKRRWWGCSFGIARSNHEGANEVRGGRCGATARMGMPLKIPRLCRTVSFVPVVQRQGPARLPQQLKPVCPSN